jgi:outer membrane protein assembly factor BamD
MTQRPTTRRHASTRPALPVKLATLLVITVTATGCSSLGKMFKKDKDAEEGQPVEEIYERAHGSMSSGNWDRAEASFRKLIAQYPYGAYTEQALMETAYAQYKAGKMEEAISTIDRFIRTYPTQRNVPYMYYLRGLANSGRDAIFLQKVWRLDPSRRDLVTVKQAYNDFSLLAERYPNSRYAGDARERMIKLRNLMARHEIDTALYYLRREAWVSAAARGRYVLETYPQSEYQNDAVAVLAEAYTRLGNTTLAADARRVLEKNDPQHAWLSGDWPDYPWAARKLNPFAGEKSAVDTSED